jgi:hypothetical protein
VTGRFSKTFNSIISAYELKEIEMTGGKFMWSNNQTNPTLEKLDRFLMSKQWEDNFPEVKINKLPREMSDHNPLIMLTSFQTPLRHMRFRFELHWIKNPTFQEKVREIWEAPCHADSAFDRIQSKLKKFKQYFKGWRFNRQGKKETKNVYTK